MFIQLSWYTYIWTIGEQHGWRSRHRGALVIVTQGERGVVTAPETSNCVSYAGDGMSHTQTSVYRRTVHCAPVGHRAFHAQRVSAKMLERHGDEAYPLPMPARKNCNESTQACSIAGLPSMHVRTGTSAIFEQFLAHEGSATIVI